MEQEFRLAKGWRIFMYVLSPVMISLGLVMVYLAFAALTEPPVNWPLFFILLAAGLALAAMMLFGMLDTIRSKFIVFEDRVQKIGVFSRKELGLSDIKGYRVDQNYIYLLPRLEQLPKIKFSVYYGNREQLTQWLSDKLPDLDLEDQLSEVQEILSKEEFGWNEEQRGYRLQSAIRLAKILNWSGTAVGLWLFFYPHPFALASGIAIVFPLLVIIALNIYKGLMRIDEKKNSAYPSLFTALLMPSMGLMVRSLLEFEVLDHQNLWGTMLALTLMLTGILFLSSKEFGFRKISDFFSIAAVGLFLAGFSYGACVHINCWYDKSVPEYFQAEILSKRISSGKHTSYKFELAAWGPRQEKEEVSVPAYLYEQMEAGEAVNVYLKAGLLNIPWFVVTEP